MQFFLREQDPRKTLEEVYAELDQAMKEIEEGSTVSHDEVFSELRRECGLPIDEEDEKQKELHSGIIDAEIKYSRYCDWRERSRILTSIGESAPEYEEEP